MNKLANLYATSVPSNNKILVALFIAIIIHTGIILGVNFTTAMPKIINKSIHITLVNKALEKDPRPVQKIPQPLKGGNKKEKVIISQERAEIKTSVVVETSPPNLEKVIKLSSAMLGKQIVQIGIKAMNRQLNAENSRIKFVDSVNTHKFQATNYIQQWQNKVEHVGNLNYPTIARKHGFSGSLLMDVGIKQDGSIYNLRIRKSSGFKSIDEAAIKIVRIGAPYAPLPPELLNELDVLIISRVWQFSDETVSTR